MRQDLRQFFINTKDDGVIAFIFSNLSKDGTDEVFNYLSLCDPETEDRWQTVYSNLYKMEERS